MTQKATPFEDDAQLHDVHFAGAREGWAVGDHGVIWHTRDGGEQWELQASHVTCSLYSVCFLTDRVGWAVGGGTQPFTRQSYGVVLQTIDGGRTWNVRVGPSRSTLASVTASTDGESGREPDGETKAASGTATQQPSALPRLTRVKFFSTTEGIAAGQGTQDQPGGVFVTEDGGESWRVLPGEISPGWLAGDFLNLETGVVAGPHGRVALVQGEQLALPRLRSLGARGLYDVVLLGNRTGWLVGDGGLVMRTEDAGLVWQPTPLPEGVRDACDFRAVCCRGPQVWVAGKPGSVIWHSGDAGKTWSKQRTSETVPIAGLHFGSDRNGCAVGALGMILRTEDGGNTWRAVRGGGRRVALMFLQGSRAQLSLKSVVQVSGESGYRSLVSVVAGDENKGTRPGEVDFADRLAEAAIAAGGSAVDVNWQLALDIPGLDRDYEKLFAEWNRRTEGRLDEMLTGNLVRQIRMWRPNVLVVETAGKGDALTRLINEMALKAVQQAGDGSRFLEQQDLSGLGPWQTDRVFVHLPPGSTGHVQIDPHEYLPRLQQTVHNFAAPAESLLFDSTATAPAHEAFRLLRAHWDERQKGMIPNGFFAGLPIAAGSAARRSLPPIFDQDLAARQRLARRQRDFAAITERTLGDSRQAGQLIAQLPEVVRGMSHAEAALQLAELAERYQQQGEWELAELTLVELVEKFPAQPVAQRGMQRLVQCWGSSEITWRRLKRWSNRQEKEQADPTGTAQAIELAAARLDSQSLEEEKTVFDIEEQPRSGGGSLEPRVPVDRTVQRAGYSVHKDLAQKIRSWQAQAVRMSRLLEQRAPQLAAAPEVQYPLAALYRERGVFAKSDEIYRRFQQGGAIGLWSRPAELEQWLSRPLAPPNAPLVTCVQTPGRPALDGVLGDGCWQDAAEMTLMGDDQTAEAGQRSLAMVSYDGEYLYLAASLPRVPGVRTDGRKPDGRRYDEDLTDYDRVTVYLDTDRDRVTYYSFSVDQRGCTSESCWQDRTWNPPGWFVAVDGDDTHWRLELAIPFQELVPRPPERGAAWGIGVVRTIPAVGQQSWTRPVTIEPRPETFGLLRFD